MSDPRERPARSERTHENESDFATRTGSLGASEVATPPNARPLAETVDHLLPAQAQVPTASSPSDNTPENDDA